MNEKVIELSKLSDKLIHENETLKKRLNEVFKKEELSKLKQDNLNKVMGFLIFYKCLNFFFVYR